MKKPAVLSFALLLALSFTAFAAGGEGGSSAASPPMPLAPSFMKQAESPVRAKGTENIAPDIMAANAYVMNVDSDCALYEKNSNERIAPASTAKMLTALTVLDYCPLGETIAVGPEISLAASDSSMAWLNRGDRPTVKQLLAALLLPSGNDAAYTLAANAGRRIAGNEKLGAQQAVKAFVKAMNQKAKEVGAVSSNFVTPDGYDARGQYTTAFDLAQIAKACLGNGALSEIASSHKISDTWACGRKVAYVNENKLLNPGSPYYYSDAVGLKTGTTEGAGSCLVSAAVINGQTYICVVMGSDADNRYLDSLNIYNEIEPIPAALQKGMATPAAPRRMIKR